MQKVKKNSCKGKVAIISVLTFILTLILVLSIVICSWSMLSNGALMIFGWMEKSEQYPENSAIYYQTHEQSFENALSSSKKIAESIQAEGTVLLKNNGALPLNKSEKKVSVFGSGSVNISYGGTGSGQGNKTIKPTDLYTALQHMQFDVNPTLKNFYYQKSSQGYLRGRGTDMNGAYYGKKGKRDYGYSINEIERSAYSSVRSSYKNYNDFALVIFSRSGGEGQDLPTSMQEFYEQDSKSYLELTTEEIDLLTEVKQNNFKKVIVLLNTMNAFESGFIEDNAYGIDAALWIGGTGEHGLGAVAKILSGELEPSGRLPDTYASDLFSAPAMQNYGKNLYTQNGIITTAAYVAYSENIYSGYRYYETRYEDTIQSQNNAGQFNYFNEVVYPFGYGLSYTNFLWSDFSLDTNDSSFTFSVKITNIGNRSGKDTVQFYIQKPYTMYDKNMKIEKASVELVGYKKTNLLKPNSSEVVSYTIDIKEIASYDTYGYKTYVAQPGNYYFTAAKNAHNAINNILVEKGADNIVGQHNKNFTAHYNLSVIKKFDKAQTGYAITNRFETESYSSVPNDLQFLSRSDWLGTWPKVYGDLGSIAGLAVKEFSNSTKDEILNTKEGSWLGKNNDKIDYVYDSNTGENKQIDIGKQVTNSKAGLNFIDMIDDSGKPLNYYDKKWDELVECMTKKELYEYLSYGMNRCNEIKSINKPTSRTSDSPMGLGEGTLFPCYPIQAATFNTMLAKELGNAVGEEALWKNIRAWYAPALNLHRTAFGGRNYEYYSEDAVLSGIFGAEVVKSVQARGLFAQLKHFALNDQDTNRGDRGNFENQDPFNGLCTYANEQTIREVYLKAFELPITQGNAHGVMTSYNRIGNTWSGGHYGLITEILRNEWGMQGQALTDYAGTFGYKYMDMDQGLRAGNSIWLYIQNGFPIDDKSSDAAIYYMQKAAKNNLYAEACSSRINGLRTTDGKVIKLKGKIYGWQWLLIGIDCVALASCATGIILLVKSIKKQIKPNVKVGFRGNDD